MATRNYLTADVDRHVSASLALLADAFPHVCKSRQEKLTRAAKHLHQIRRELAWTVAETEAARKVDLVAAADPWVTPGATARANAALAACPLSAEERRFANNLGELVVGLAYDAFEQTERQALGYDSACIAAAVEVALAIVREPDGGNRIEGVDGVPPEARDSVGISKPLRPSSPGPPGRRSGARRDSLPDASPAKPAPVVPRRPGSDAERSASSGVPSDPASGQAARPRSRWARTLANRTAGLIGLVR